MNKFDYKNLTPFKWFVLENFPFIEADFDALTEWQLFCKLGKEINKIIDSQNVVGTEMEKISKAFIELQNYVNNYFDNLDVQEEINNKLNQMAENGTLTNLIKNYIDPIYEAYETSINSTVANISNKYEAYETSINSTVANISNKVDSYIDNTPQAVSSVSEMTNTHTIYVNTTDGNWYYYNTQSNNWTIGGSFQNFGISEKQIKNYMIDGLERTEYGNVVDTEFFTENWVINNANQNGKIDNGFNTTNEVEVIPSTTYRVSGSICFINFYDENRNYLEQQINGTIHILDITAPSAAKYVRISGDKATFQDLMFVNLNAYIGELTNPLTIKPCVYKFNTNKIYLNGNMFENGSITEDKLSNEIQEKLNNISTYFSNKKIACLGDSITYGYNGNAGNDNIARVENPYPLILKNILHLKDSYNYGVNGSTIAGGGSGTDVEGTFPMNIRYTNMNNDADFVIVMGGTNDHGQSLPLGTINDTTNQTFYGALDVLINGLITKYTSKSIGFIIPLQKGHYGANDLGFTFNQYCEAIKEKCIQYSIPYFDLHNECGSNPMCSTWNTWKNNNLPDSLHPNQDFYYILAKKISNFVERL